ncbi:MAG: hypothetical protein ABH804_00095 [archaeon]
MVREDILGGLRTAVSKGETLRQAMITFFNAGYKKEDIESSAKKFHEQMYRVSQKQEPQQVVSRFMQSVKVQPVQAVSGYAQPVQKQSNYIIIVLISILLVLLGSLAVTIIYKTQIISFLNSLF